MKGIVIAGPTAVGKTSISLEVAQKLDADIVSSDSMQVYKYLDIGTAKISEKEMCGIKHHMIDIVEPIHKYSVGEYYRDTGKILSELSEKDRTIVLTGGTGLYINAVTDGIAILPESREDLRKELNSKSLESLCLLLEEYDRESFEEIDLKNRRRVERAVEVYILSGKKMSDLKRNNIKNNNYNFKKYVLIRNREELYSRIDKRVDIMFEQGLLNEALNIYQNFKEGIDEIAAIGYRELFMYFRKEISFNESVELIKKNSRNYAKRQLTWFRNDKNYVWLDLDVISEKEAIEKIIREV